MDAKPLSDAEIADLWQAVHDENWDWRGPIGPVTAVRLLAELRERRAAEKAGTAKGDDK